MQRQMERILELEKVNADYERLFGKLSETKTDSVKLLQEKEELLKETVLKMEAYKMVAIWRT